MLIQSSAVPDALSLFHFVSLPLPTCQFSSLRRSPLAQKSSNFIRKPQRPQRRKQWTAQQMDATLHSVTCDEFSGNRAADLQKLANSLEAFPFFFVGQLAVLI